jgi:hypothetical protein
MRATLSIAILTCLLAVPALAADDELDPFREYAGKTQPPRELKEAFAGFVRSAKGGSVLAHLLPHSVDITREPRPAETREYGSGVNEDFLKNGFTPMVFTVRDDGDDCYLIRTGSTALWWVQTKSGAWKVYRYMDKPIK